LKKADFNKKVIEIKRLEKSFKLQSQSTYFERVKNLFKRGKHVKALSAINLDIYEGDTVGIIGRNGSGKTTLLNIIMGSIRADKGSVVKTNGDIIRLALGLGMDPNLSGHDNIYVNGSVLGLSFKKIGLLYNSIVEFAGLSDYIQAPVKTYSSGMKQRLMFSIAMYAPSDIFLLDEFFGGTGDSNFREKSDKMFHKRILEGKTVILVSHSMAIIRKFCKKCIWIEKGHIMNYGETHEIIKKYQDFNKINSKDNVGGAI